MGGKRSGQKSGQKLRQSPTTELKVDEATDRDESWRNEYQGLLDGSTVSDADKASEKPAGGVKPAGSGPFSSGFPNGK